MRDLFILEPLDYAIMAVLVVLLVMMSVFVGYALGREHDRARLRAFDDSLRLCSEHSPEMWSGPGSCVLCEATDEWQQLQAVMAHRDRLVERVQVLEQRLEVAKGLEGLK